MKKFTMFACLLMVMVFALAAFADERPQLVKGDDMIYGGSVATAKAGLDTINLMAATVDPTNTGSEPQYKGDFETNEWEDGKWHSIDLTQPTTSNYSVSNYNQGGPNLAAWCGDIGYPSCDDSLDPEGGYGNDWHDQLDFVATVPFPTFSTTVDVSALLMNDTEPGYDTTYLSYDFDGEDLANIGGGWDGKFTSTVTGSVTYTSVNYVNGNEIRVMFRFQSDGGWSDGDCAWPTGGAHQIDDIEVTVTNNGNIQAFNEDFEGGTGDLGDGLGDRGEYDWAIAFPTGVGDYAQLWVGLEDVDPCHSNYTNQMAFIDDGVIVPETGGTDCIQWCYGPFGFIVNTEGGLAGPDFHTNNVILSEVMDWPNDAFDGIRYDFEVYRHEEFAGQSAGQMYIWAVRSADTDNSAGNGVQVLEDQPFKDRNFVYYGGPDYIVASNEVTDLMEPGRDELQVRAGLFEAGYFWGWDGPDGTPAPYFDNFKVRIYPYNGPGMSTRSIDVANDHFPARGDIDFEDLGSLSVRFDMARNISPVTDERIDFGDSIVVDIVPVRAGSDLHGTPTLHWTLNPNPVFNDHRTSLDVVGSAPGSPAVGASGIADPDAWAFDLADSNFLFPGDVLQYYITASDAVDGGDIQTSTMPGDTTGYGYEWDALGYSTTFTVRALPTINDDGLGNGAASLSTPPILMWNDFFTRGGQEAWTTALNNAGKILGVDYDLYNTNGPTSGVSNGLGGRAGSELVLENYTDMLYTAGNLGSYTITNGDLLEGDGGNDAALLMSWLQLGNKDLFMTGDNVVLDLAVNGGTTTLQFAEDFMGVSYQTNDIRPDIDNQTTPLVKAVTGNPVFQNISSWIAFGGCNGINTFDGVNKQSAATLLAEFTDPSGAIGAYTYSAGTLNYPEAAPTSRVVSLTYDFMFVYTDNSAKADAPLTGRAQMLRDVLAYFGLPFDPGSVSATPELQKFAARNYPNPFNPSTKIFYTMPKAGHLTLKIYNVRGELVKTLIDGQVKAGEDHVTWDGKNNQNANVSSGVYFYEARNGGNVVVNKMALVK